MDSNQEEYLRTIYFVVKHPASFAGPVKLHKFAQKDGQFSPSLASIQKEETSTTQKQVNCKFSKLKIVDPHIRYMWEADTANITFYAKKHEGYSYFLVVIDAFS